MLYYPVDPYFFSHTFDKAKIANLSHLVLLQSGFALQYTAFRALLG